MVFGFGCGFERVLTVEEIEELGWGVYILEGRVVELNCVL